jgi:hypothetical protein
MSPSIMFRRLIGFLTNLDNRKLIAESMSEYDWMIGGNADPTCISPAHTGGRLGPVPKQYEAVIQNEKFGGQRDKDGWVVPTNLPYEKLKLLKQLWVKTPTDLLGEQAPPRLAPNGDPITNYVLVEDFGKGGDSTATPLLFASLPMFTSLLLVAMDIGAHVSGMVGGALGLVSILGIGAGLIALEELFGVAKMVKALCLGVVLPYVMVEYFSTGLTLSFLHNLSPIEMMGAGLGVIKVIVLVAIIFVVYIISSAGSGGGNGEGFWNRGLDGLKSMFWLVLIFGGLDFAIEHLPAMFHAAVWFIPGCLMAVRHTDAFWRWRAEELLIQESHNKSMRMVQSFLPDGPVQGVYREQVINASQDTSPVIIFGKATGTLNKMRRSPLYCAVGQIIALSLRDLSMHFMGFGETGSGKTTSLARPALFKWVTQRGGGALIQCGKGQLPWDLEPLIDIKLMPGFNWAPLQGMDGIQLGSALKSFKPSGKAVKDADENGKDSHWNDGANLVISHVVYLHYQLHRHELAVRAANRIRSAQMDAKALLFDLQEMDAKDVTDQREKAAETKAECQELLEKDRLYRWTYSGVWKTMQACNKVISQPNNVRLIGPEFGELKGFLGIATGQSSLNDQELARKQMYTPECIHAEAQQSGSTLLAAIDYITNSYVALPDETRQSFWSNISMMFSPLISTGTVFCNAEGTPWVEIEQGETLADVFRGKVAGVFLNTDQYGVAALIVNQLSRSFIYSGLRRRPDSWAKDPTQKPVMIMIDECHMVIGKAESDLVTTLRSRGGTFFFLTQGVGQLLSTAGFSKQEAYAMLNQFATLCALKTDYETVEYLAQRAPVLFVTGGKSTHIGGTGYIDVESAVSELANSPLENPALEQHSYYQRMERAGFGAITIEGSKQMRMDDGHHMRKRSGINIPYRTINAISGGTLKDDNGNPVFEKMMRAVSADEILANLVTKGNGSAIWIATRAGAPRVDFVQLDGMSAEEVRERCASLPSPNNP